MTEWTFKGRAKRIEDVDLPRIGATIGVGEDELHAFMEVEAAGKGFDDLGRPKILFEPHHFYRLLGPGKARDRAVKEGIAWQKWNPKGYNVSSFTRLRKAMAINETLALMSCSWGLFQIMGFNHGAAGYATVQEMVREFMDDEDNHVEAAVRFLINKKIDDDLRAHRWDVIEKVYNGGGYGGAYAAKMRKAFAKWQKIKDTPYTPEPPAKQPLPASDLRQEAPSPAPAQNPPSEPPSLSVEAPSTPQSPTPTQAVVTTAVAVGGGTALGLHWMVVATIGIALFAGLMLVFFLRKSDA